MNLYKRPYKRMGKYRYYEAAGYTENVPERMDVKYILAAQRMLKSIRGDKHEAGR